MNGILIDTIQRQHCNMAGKSPVTQWRLQYDNPIELLGFYKCVYIYIYIYKIL